jgi:WD40 repeat protein
MSDQERPLDPGVPAERDDDTRPMSPITPSRSRGVLLNLVVLGAGIAGVALWTRVSHSPAGLMPIPSLVASEPRRAVRAGNGRLESFRFPSGRVTAVCWDADGKRLAAGTSEGLLEVWDVERGERATEVRANGEILATAFCPPSGPSDTRSAHSLPDLWSVAGNVYHGRYESCQLMGWRLSQAEAVVRQSLNTPGILQAVFSPRGRALVVTTDSDGRLWDLEKRETVTGALGNCFPCTVAVVERPRVLVLLGGARGQLLLADKEKGLIRRVDMDPRVARTIVALSPDGRMAAVALSYLGRPDDQPKPLRICTDIEQEDRAVIEIAETFDKVLRLQFTEGPRLFGLCLDFDEEGGTPRRRPALRAWQPQSGKRIAEIPLPADARDSLVSPDAKWVAVIRDGGQIDIQSLEARIPRGED